MLQQKTGEASGVKFEVTKEFQVDPKENGEALNCGNKIRFIPWISG